MTAADRLIRVLTAVTVVMLGGIAAVISYRHAYGVATAYGENGLTAALTPLTADGLVFVASLVMLDSARRRVPAPALARLAVGLGIGATVAVNVLHGIAHGPIGAVVAAWPAVTLVVVVELLMTTIRRGQAPEPATEPAAAAGEWWPLPALLATAGPDDGPQVGNGTPDDTGPVDPKVIATARDRFAAVLAAGALPSVRAIRRELRVGHPKAVAIRAALGEGIS